MKLLSRSEFKKLGESTNDYSVSIYLPTHVAGSEIQQDPIRLKNLLNEAQAKLLEAGLSESDGKKMLKPAFEMLDDLHFWRYQSRGLALFMTPENIKIYRLPLDFESLAVVSDRFHLKPLLPLFFENPYFYILALSQNQVRFFQSTRYQISEIPLENIPSSLEEALQYDEPEKQLQFHSSNRGGSQPIYHGQGVGTTDDKTDIRRFLTQVSQGIYDYLGNENAPLMIASVDYLQPIYREVNHYSHLLKEGIDGNPDILKPDELREAAWPKVAHLIEESHHQALDKYHTLEGTGKASENLSQLLTAAYRGQIDTLFVKTNAHRWGQFDAQSGQLEIHDQAQLEDDDLLDLAAIQTFLQGGTVYSLGAETMPKNAVAAIYRYGIPAEVS
jgi:hypothetical protein